MAKVIKNSKKVKSPNYRAVIYALIILVMFVLFVNDDINDYMDIVYKRNDVAASVRTASLDLDAIQTGYEECSEAMQNLKEKSQLGTVLADLDKSTMGQIGNYILIAILQCGALYMVWYILKELWYQILIIADNIKRRLFAKKEENSHQ